MNHFFFEEEEEEKERTSNDCKNFGYRYFLS